MFSFLKFSMPCTPRAVLSFTTGYYRKMRFHLYINGSFYVSENHYRAVFSFFFRKRETKGGNFIQRSFITRKNHEQNFLSCFFFILFFLKATRS